MIDKIPTNEELKQLIGDAGIAAWKSVCSFVEENYNMDILWDKGGKAGIYECKFRKSSKTLCSLYPREGHFGFMVIYGKAEREKFETVKSDFSQEIQQLYDKATTYHDGKWIMVSVYDNSLVEDIKGMILIKKKPNKRNGL